MPVLRCIIILFTFRIPSENKQRQKKKQEMPPVSGIRFPFGKETSGLSLAMLYLVEVSGLSTSYCPVASASMSLLAKVGGGG